MSKNKLVVVMICHNDVSHLKRSIGTVLDQLQDGVSFLFVDDSSTDGSSDFASHLIGDKGEVIVTPRNLNVGGARNYGVDHLKSKPEEEQPEYVWFHDCDDYLYENGIKRVMETLEKNPDVDCVSIPIGTRRTKDSNNDVIEVGAVGLNSLQESPCGPVGTCFKIFKLAKYVRQAEFQMCEHVAWHFLQFDQFDSWAKVEGEEPCYIWDRTNNRAISETVDFCKNNSKTIEDLAASNVLVNSGLKDRWISDNLRNIANMYDVRHQLHKPWVKQAWFSRFRKEVANMLSGHHIH